ncbi:MAG: peptidoglycan editing factor PgeF [Clostridia bacterium]|nr:peptidoglycan editing factor PgeF [Clostridia bacterium]
MVLPISHTLAVHGTASVPYYSFPAIDRVPFIKHGFSTRLGGVSKGIYSSMNLSFTRGDNEADVLENFRMFCDAIGVDYQNAVISSQEHHTAIRKVTSADKGKGIVFPRDYTDVDGLMTDEPNVVLCTQYADCVPLFFADPVRRVVATSHSGWKGTVAQIGAATIAAMQEEYGCEAEDILVGIGPSIGPCCFEVDEPVYEAFKELSFLDADLLKSVGNGKYYIDLWNVNRQILLNAGVLPEHITVTDLCTKCHPETFWSHRVTGGERGSLAGFIAITEDV